MHSVKEKAANAAASAKVGVEKTKATMEEKVEKMAAHDPVQKQMATEKKDEKIRQAKIEKHESVQHNSAAKNAGKDEGFTVSEPHGQPVGAQQTPAAPGQATGQPTAQATDTPTEARPVIPNTGVGASNIS